MYETIVVPLDGSKLGEAAIPYVQELVSVLCPERKVEVVLLRVISEVTHYVVAAGEAVQVPYTEAEMKPIKETAKSYLDKMGAGIKAKGASIRSVVATGDAAQEIIKVAEENKAGLVAMSTHGRGGIAHVVIGSVAEKVMRGTSVPVLMIRGLKQKK